MPEPVAEDSTSAANDDHKARLHFVRDNAALEGPLFHRQTLDSCAATEGMP